MFSEIVQKNFFSLKIPDRSIKTGIILQFFVMGILIETTVFNF